jgi:hypothetical protein
MVTGQVMATFLKIGKFVRFDPPEVARWINDQRVGISKERSAHRGGA